MNHVWLYLMVLFQSPRWYMLSLSLIFLSLTLQTIRFAIYYQPTHRDYEWAVMRWLWRTGMVLFALWAVVILLRNYGVQLIAKIILLTNA